MSSRPGLFSILRSGSYLVASVRTALDDTAMTRFRNDLVAQIGGCRSTGVIIDDDAAVEVLDSFGFTTIRSIAWIAPLRGALPVIVGNQPDVALTIVRHRHRHRHRLGRTLPTSMTA